MTNFEKLKELREDYEVALVVSFINSHVMTILSYSGASENLDAFDCHFLRHWLFQNCYLLFALPCQISVL